MEDWSSISMTVTHSRFFICSSKGEIFPCPTRHGSRCIPDVMESRSKSPDAIQSCFSRTQLTRLASSDKQCNWKKDKVTRLRGCSPIQASHISMSSRAACRSAVVSPMKTSSFGARHFEMATSKRSKTAKLTELFLS